MTTPELRALLLEQGVRISRTSLYEWSINRTAWSNCVVHRTAHSTLWSAKRLLEAGLILPATTTPPLETAQ